MDHDADLHRALQESRDAIQIQRDRELDAEDGHDPLQASGAMASTDSPTLTPTEVRDTPPTTMGGHMDAGALSSTRTTSPTTRCTTFTSLATSNASTDMVATGTPGRSRARRAEGLAEGSSSPQGLQETISPKSRKKRSKPEVPATKSIWEILKES